MQGLEKSMQQRNARQFKNEDNVMKLNDNERLVLAGEMPLRAPNGKILHAVPVYRIVPAANANAGSAETIAPNERLILAGTTENKLTAEERYKALLAGDTPPQTRPTPLYIKEPADGINAAARLSECEQRALNPLITDLITEFSAAMQEMTKLEV